MKNALSLFVVTLLGIYTSATAQTTYTLDNQTNCDIEIWVECRNNCRVIGGLGWDVAANHTIMLDDCVGSTSNIFTVNWVDPNCQVAPIFIENGACLNLPSTDFLQVACGGCTTGGAGSTATVTVVGNTLTITP